LADSGPPTRSNPCLFPALGLKLAGGKSRGKLRARDDRDGL